MRKEKDGVEVQGTEPKLRTTQYGFEALEVGQSKEFKTNEVLKMRTRISASAAAYSKKHGKKFSTKQTNESVILIRVS